MTIRSLEAPQYKEKDLQRRMKQFLETEAQEARELFWSLNTIQFLIPTSYALLYCSTLSFIKYHLQLIIYSLWLKPNLKVRAYG